MIPYGGTSDDPEPIFPWVNIGLIVACFLVFFYELALGSEGGNTRNNFLNGYALVPCFGGFITGLLLVKLFTQPARVRQLRPTTLGS